MHSGRVTPDEVGIGNSCRPDPVEGVSLCGDLATAPGVLSPALVARCSAFLRPAAAPAGDGANARPTI
jgi:hypothetical protein